MMRSVRSDKIDGALPAQAATLIGRGRGREPMRLMADGGDHLKRGGWERLGEDGLHWRKGRHLDMLTALRASNLGTDDVGHRAALPARRQANRYGGRAA